MSANFPRLDTLDSLILEPGDPRECVELHELDPPARYAKAAEAHGLQVINTLYRRILQGSKYSPPQPPVLTVHLHADTHPDGRERDQNLLEDFTSWVRHLRICLIVTVPQPQQSDATPVIRFRALDWLMPILARATNLDNLWMKVIVHKLDSNGNVVYNGARELLRYGSRLRDFLHGEGNNPVQPGRTLHQRMEELLTEMLATEGIWNIDQITDGGNRTNDEST